MKPPEWATPEAIALAEKNGWTLHPELAGIFVNEDGKNVAEDGERRDKNGRPLVGAAGRKPSQEQIEKMQRGRHETGRLGGRKRQPRRTEVAAKIAEDRMAEMESLAYDVLEAQLSSEDEAIAQKAAIKVLEYQRGKPIARIEQETTEVIRYEVAYAGPPDEHEIIEGEVVKELTTGEGDDAGQG